MKNALKTCREQMWPFPALTRYTRDVKGMAAIETAFILPVLVLLFMGMIDLTNGFSAKRKITLATSTIGDLVTQAKGKVDQTALDGYYNAVKPILEPFPDTKAGIAIFNFRKGGTESSPTYNKIWGYKSGKDCGSAPQIDQTMKNLMTAGNDLVVAIGCYEFHPIVGYVIRKQGFTITEKNMLRPRHSLQLQCTDCTS